eukprot:5848503-Amphidinium_carterae.1
MEEDKKHADEVQTQLHDNRALMEEATRKQEDLESKLSEVDRENGQLKEHVAAAQQENCLLYTSDAADDTPC